ncbi:MAG: pyridoxamine 5'-phosphate oxidase family protein [Solirubrobacteraceae bacterium]
MPGPICPAGRALGDSASRDADARPINEAGLGSEQARIAVGLMTSWQEFVEATPEFAQRVEGLFTAYKHHTMATVRKDGGPRISGTEVEIVSGELCLGMMPTTRRAADLRRDPRVAIHSHSVDPPDGDPGAWSAEAKLSGRAEELTDEHRASDRFRVDREHVVLTRIESRELIETWTPERGLLRRQR